MDLDEKYSRLLGIYSQDQLNKLISSHICIIGLGGVGSYCVTALARSGVGKLTIIDFDKIEESNINRQEFATLQTTGKNKVDVATQFINDINPKIEVVAQCKKVDSSNVSSLIERVDYIIDAIDDMQAKLEIVKYSQEIGIPIISCMGTAQRMDAIKLKIDDLFNTNVCPMCRRFRKLAKDNGIQNLDVLYSNEDPIKINTEVLGSTSYIPPIAGLMLAGYVINKII